MKYHYHMSRAISKALSANDVGDTGGHQAGILIPKNPDILSFFPALGIETKNPRVHLRFLDDNEQDWFFHFIYYNNFYFGGTRREYRLTGMTGYIRQNDLKVGDEIILYEDESGDRHIKYKRITSSYAVREGTLRISNQWKIIKVKE
jgi:hypothetical protein